MNGNKFTFDSFLFGILILSKVVHVIEAEVTLTPSSTDIAENNPLTLTCSYSGSLTVQTYTMRVSSTVASKGSLLADCSVFITTPNPTLYEYTCPTNKQLRWTIKNVTRINEGDTWRCLVGFTTPGSEEANFSVNVQVPIQSVTMTSPTTSTVTVRENTQTVFVCRTSGGLPAATVRWYKDQRTPVTSDDVEITNYATSSSRSTSDNLLYVTSTLRYSPGKHDNGIKIYCTAKNSANTLSSNRKAQLNVQYSPDGPPEIQGYNNGGTYNIIKDSPGLLSCSVKGGNPLATLTWNCYNAGTAAVTTRTTVTKNVTWTALRDQDRSCICQSSHPVAGTQSVFVRVQILYTPTTPTFRINSTQVSGTIKVIRNNPLSVSCISTGNPTPSYTWTNPNMATTNGQELSVSNVQNNGRYTCTVRNSMNPSVGATVPGRTTSFIDVIVLYGPDHGSLKLTPSSATYVQNEGDIINDITCSSKCFPDCIYRWTKSGASRIISYTAILSLGKLNENQAGTYKCTAANPETNRSVSKQVELFVRSRTGPDIVG